MESKFYGVPISATQATPTGIRAPLTNDDSDFESNNGKKNSYSSSYGSDSGFESEGFVSGDDGFETASERPFVHDPDDQNLGQTRGVNQFVVSRPFVKAADEESVGQGSDFGEYDDSRSYLTDPYREIVEEHDSVEEYSDSRPFVVDGEDEVAVGTTVDDVVDGNFAFVGTTAVNSAIPLIPKQGIPIAQLSWDSDDESRSSVVLESNDFSGAVRIPNPVVLERLDSAPKVRVSDVSDGEEESEFENIIQSGMAEDLTLSKNVQMVLGSESSDSREEDKAEIETVQNFISDGGGEGDNTIVGRIVEYQVPSEEPILLSQELSNDAKVSAEESQVIDSSAEEEKIADSYPERSSDITLDSPREESGLPNLGDDDLIRENNVIQFTGAASDGQKLSEMEEEIYHGTEHQDIVNAIETESYVDAIEDDEVDSVDCTDFSVPSAAQEHVLSSTSSSSDVTCPPTMENDLPKLSDETQHRQACFNLDSETNHIHADPAKFIKDEEVSLSHEDGEGLTFKDSEGMNLIIDDVDVQVDTAEYDVEVSQGYLQKVDGEMVTDSDEEVGTNEENEVRQTFDLAEQVDTAENDGEVSQGYLQKVDGEMVTDSDEEVDTDEENEVRKTFDSEALTALLRAATGVGSEGTNVTISLADGTQVFSLERPTSLGSTFRSSTPTQPTNPDILTPYENKTEDKPEEILSEEEKKKLEKLQQIRVKYLRLIHRLNRSPEDSVASQVLHRLLLAVGKSAPQSYSLVSALKAVNELEAEDTDNLNFSLNVLVIGKTGVGKSATINSIFGESKATIDAFKPATGHVKEIIGQLEGVAVRILDTPGLKSSLSEQSINRKTLLSIKKFMMKCTPDVVLYVDRIDAQSRDLGDLPLLKSITRYLGPSIWQNAIIALTHAASSPPDGPSGYPVSYEMFVAQRSRVIQQLINHSVGDPHTFSAGLMSPVSLVENHPFSAKNGKGEILLPNGENWRSQLLLLCYSLKILSETDSIIKEQDGLVHRKLFGFPMRSLPLPYFLSSLLQSNVHPKLSNHQGGEDIDSDIEVAYSSDSNQEDEEEYDNLPPFRPLRKSHIARLSKEQKRAYFEEYDYRVKLLQKKQWKEEVKRLRNMKKNGRDGVGDYMEEDADQEAGSPAGVAVPLPDMVLPSSFDGDNPSYRYRYLEPSSQLLARPVMDSNGWDHDCGYDGVSIENHLAIAAQYPAVIALQLTKDKKEFNIHLDSSVAAKTGENGSTMVGFDIQTVGKQLAYILKGETKVKILKTNKTAAGVSITFLGENLVTGLKLEDQLAIGKRLVVVGSTGTIRSQGNAAYGANLELRLREKDYPVGQDQSTLGLSLTKWRNDLIWGCNLQSQFSVGRNSKLAVRAGLNSKRSGQITVRTSSSDQLQIAILGLLPIARAIMRAIFPEASEKHVM